MIVMKLLATTVVVAGLSVAGSAQGQGQGRGGAPGGAQPAQAAQAAQPSNETIVIGCAARADQNALTLKDFRSDITYRVEASGGDTDIAWHAGHQLEVHGTLDSSAPAGQPR